MTDYKDWNTVIRLLKEAQDADEDNRELVKEAHLFVTKPDGQWEPEWWESSNGKPRYTFDQTSPIIDQVAGQLEMAEFGIDIDPAGGDASKDTAEVLVGMVRNIEKVSNATHIYADAGRNIVTGGFDVWHLRTDYLDDESFDQDILIEPVMNCWDRVWFDTSSKRQDKADAKCGFLLSAITKNEYMEKYPEGSEMSVSDNSRATAYFDKADYIMIGHVYYVEQKPRQLVKTNLGRTFWADTIKDVEDELALTGETVEARRDVLDDVVYLRKFDGSGWLNRPEETVWNRVPLIPVYANYKTIENKEVYSGVVKKLIDPQRVLNYSLSREIEEGALAPRAKYWMTPAQAKGHTKTLATMNTNSDPVQLFNPDQTNPGAPQQSGGAQINPGLRTISDGMQNLMGATAGIFAAGMGDNPNAQSGVAIEKLQNKGNNVTQKFFRALEVSITATAQAIIKAIPKVYDTQRTVRIIGGDGAASMAEINSLIIDQQTGQPVMLNDLSVGKYDVTCEAGPSFSSRQDESVMAITELAQINPAILELGSDVLMANISSPGIDKIGERLRLQLLNAGVIPEEQLTDEEKAMMKQAQDRAAQQGGQNDPMAIIAQAEQMKAEASAMKVQADAQKSQIESQIAIQKAELSQMEMQIKMRELQVRESEIMLRLEREHMKLGIDMSKEHREAMNDATGRLNTQADTLGKIKDATGADSVMSPSTPIAYEATSQKLAKDTIQE